MLTKIRADLSVSITELKRNPQAIIDDAQGGAIALLNRAIMAAMNGGDINQGFLNGALSGAMSGAMFYCAGSVIDGSMFGTEAITSNVGKAAVHTVTGAASGAVNASITGGDVGKEALIGALSAGIRKYTGVDNFAGRTAIEAGTGSVSSLMGLLGADICP